MKNSNVRVTSKEALLSLINSNVETSRMVRVFKVIHRNGPISRRRISKLSGYEIGAIPRVVNKLKNYHLIEELSTEVDPITGQNVGMLTSRYKPLNE